MPSDKAHSFKTWDDPWKGMSPEDRREAHRLFMVAIRTRSGWARQNEAREKLEALLKKYGIGSKEDAA